MASERQDPAGEAEEDSPIVTKRKVALVMRDFKGEIGGAERFSVNLARGLVERGLDVEIWGGSLESGLGMEEIFREISFARKPSSLKVWSFCRGYQHLLETTEERIVLGITQVYPVDVYRVGSGIYPHWLRLQNPNPLRRWIHLLTRPVYWANRGIEKQIMASRRLKKVVVNSELEKKNLRHYYPMPEEKVEVIYNGVDLEHFHPRWKGQREKTRGDLNTDNASFVLLFPSNNFKRKGLETVLRAMAVLRDQRLVLWVAGKGKVRFFQSLSEHLGLGDRVRFLGQRSDMARLYGAADCMVLPTQYDSFSNVVLEAMACDLPVITTRNNGAAEAIEPGVNGFILMKYNDAETLGQRIESVIEKVEEWEGKARRRADEFTLEKSVGRYIHLLESLGC
ncbi:MAG: glycosyltransferase family 4 protein [bacterium]|nr:glycosyltransferase family 4 protein [bacterium]